MGGHQINVEKMLLLAQPLARVTKPISSSSLFQRVWPAALISLELVITVAWTTLLGYGLVELVERAF